MAIWSLTREKVDKLLQEVANKELEIDELLKLSPKQLWATDLDGFITEWRLALEEDERRASEGTVKKKRGGKMLGKGAKGKKKADADDSDYEAKKKKTATAKAKVDAKKQSTLGFKPAEAEKIDKKPAKAVKKEALVTEEELTDDDFDMLKQNVAKAKPAAAPKSKEKVPPVELLSSSPAAAEKIGALSKRTEVYHAESDDDDGGVMFMDTVSSKVPSNKSLKAESEGNFEDSEAEKPKKKAPLKKAAVITKAPAKARAATKPAAKSKAMPKIFDETEDDEPPPPRAATNKPKRAAAARKSIVDISDTETDDDGLGDVSAMVKGVGGADAASIQLFKESPAKPKASSKISMAKKATRPAPKKAPINLYSDSEDDQVVKKSEHMLPSDSEEDLVPLKAVVKPAVKKAALARAAPTKKAALPRKPPVKSAAKSKGKKLVESEDELDTDMVEKLPDSDEDVDMEEPEARPVSRGRTARGAASKVASYKIPPVDSEDEDDDDDEASDDFGDDSE